MAKILTNTPATTPVDTLSFKGQLPTKIPVGLTKYSTLISLYLSGNLISSIKKGDLKLEAKVKSIDLSGNQITSIAPASLPGYIT